MRTFIAIELPSDTKEKIEEAISPFRKLNLSVSWVKSKNLHLTLKFLGEVDEKKVDDIVLALEQAVKGKEKFEMDLKDFGTFPNLKRPRVIWIGIEKGKESLIVIQNEIEKELSKLGFPQEEKGFSPHLTIGRVKSAEGIERLTEQIKNVNFVVEDIEVGEVVLMRSQLHPQGAAYTPIRKFKLK
ncbi:MAG TPA: RNA 2',3'-cyclic phosphodiesterase [candidate division Zixibacteria bacterium]